MPGALSEDRWAPGSPNCASDRNESGGGHRGDPGSFSAGDGAGGQRLCQRRWIAALAESGIEALVSTAAEGRRRLDFRPAKAEAPVKEPAEWSVMTETRQRGAVRCTGMRQQTVEPVYGIIKAVLGFTGFRCVAHNSAGEWAWWRWTASACTTSWRWPCDGAVGPTGRSKSPAHSPEAS